MRFMPIEGVCYAGLEDISKLGKKVLPEHFPTGDDVPQTTVSRSPHTLITSDQQLQRLMCTSSHAPGSGQARLNNCHNICGRL